MATIIPDVQMGSLGGTLIWGAIALIVIVALFTTGLGPVLIAAVAVLAAVIVLYFLIARIIFRLKRGR